MRPAVVVLAATTLPFSLALSSGCGRWHFDAEASESDASTERDAAADAPDFTCDPQAPFGVPVRIASLDDPNGAQGGTLRLAADELSGYFWSYRSGAGRIYFAQRASLADPFAVAPVTGLGAPGNDLDPILSTDGTLLVFRHNGPGDDIWIASRASPTVFTSPAAATTLDVGAVDQQPFLSAANHELLFSSLRSGAGDLYRSIRSGTTFSAPSLVGELADPSNEEGDPALSVDGKTLFFRSNRPASLGGFNIYSASRLDLTSPFDAPALVPNVSSEGDDGPSYVSADGCRLYLSSDRSGTNAIYVAQRGHDPGP